MAQSDRGTVTGTVTDPSDAGIQAAKLALRNTATGALMETQTTPTGNYTFGSVPVGTYDLTVEAPGFKTAVERTLTVELDQTHRLDVHLVIGSTTESITVEANSEILKTENAEQSMNVSGAKLNELPINFGGTGSSGGIRNWLTFTYLAPGVAGTSANSEVNGLPCGLYKVYLEGQDSTSPVAVGWTSTLQAASVEAITEFAVQSSNYSAEYGQVLGGVYNFTTKSGTNQLHGSVYEEFTNEALNAAQPWNHVRNRDRQSDYGFSVGAPIWIPKVYNGKNKTFFFFNLERFKTNLSSTNPQSVPTAAYRNGDFSCALYTSSTNCSGATQTLTDPNTGYSYLAQSDLRSEHHLHGFERASGSYSISEQYDPHVAHGSGRPQDSAVDPRTDQHANHVKLGSDNCHGYHAADLQPQVRSEFWGRNENELFLE